MDFSSTSLFVFQNIKYWCYKEVSIMKISFKTLKISNIICRRAQIAVIFAQQNHLHAYLRAIKLTMNI